MSPRSMQMPLAFALGFAGGLCCSACRLATDRLPSLSLLSRKPRPSAFAALAVLIAPFLIMRAILIRDARRSTASRSCSSPASGS
jgi:hypothetical protein